MNDTIDDRLRRLANAAAIVQGEPARTAYIAGLVDATRLLHGIEAATALTLLIDKAIVKAMAKR